MRQNHVAVQSSHIASIGHDGKETMEVTYKKVPPPAVPPTPTRPSRWRITPPSCSASPTVRAPAGSSGTWNRRGCGLETPNTITADTTDALKAEVSPIKVNAGALVISAPEHVEVARDFIRSIKERRAKVDATFDVHIKTAHQAHKALVATKKTFTDDLDEAEKIIKRKVGDYQLECERKAEEERRRAQKEAEAEQARKLDAARKKIEKAMEKAGSIQEQIDAVQAVIEDESTNETELAMAERQLEVLNLQLQGLNDKAQAVQEQAAEIAEAPAYIPPAAVVEKTKGVGIKKVYLITSIDSPALIKAISEGKGSPALVKTWDETMIKKLANMGIFLPGVGYQEDRSISVR